MNAFPIAGPPAAAAPAMDDGDTGASCASRAYRSCSRGGGGVNVIVNSQARQRKILWSFACASLFSPTITKRQIGHCLI